MAPPRVQTRAAASNTTLGDHPITIPWPAAPAEPAIADPVAQDAAAPVATPHPRQSEGFRPDLEGLRGVAILMVLLFHAGVPAISGGFVGVDVFFVLSGFLITGLLISERERTGRVSLRRFYARRARRILPAATVALLAILVLSWFMLPPIDIEGVSLDVAASAVFVGNIRFAAQATDYFAAGIAPSPVVHYWSLAVEEQFYLLWPALLILVTRGPRPRLGAGITLIVMIVASLGSSIVLTDISQPWAFFSLTSRAWQLGLGGLLAIATAGAVGTVAVGRLPGWLFTGAGLLGLGMVVASLFVIDPATPYPGAWALLPTIGAAAVIVAGLRSRAAGLVLDRAPLRFLGRISFSLYLVHWPLLVLPAAGLAIGEELPLVERLALAGLAIAVATASWRWIEEPIRRGRRLSFPPLRTLATAGTAIALTVALATGTAVAAARQLDDPGDGGIAVGDPSMDPGFSYEPAPSIDPAFSFDPEPSGEPEASLEPELSPPPSSPGPESPNPSPAPSVTPQPAPRGPIPLPRDIKPSLSAVRGDKDRLTGDGCLLFEGATRLPDCIYGNPDSATTVALVGDSHAAQWFPAIEQLAKKHDWRLVVMTKVSCRFVDVPQYSRPLKRAYTECATWLPRVHDRLVAIKPTYTFIEITRALQPIRSADNDPARQGRLVAPLLEGVPGKYVMIGDTPQSYYDVPACISSHRRDVRPCETDRAAAFGWRYLKLENAFAKATGGTVIKLSPTICPRDPCPVIQDGMIIYRDDHHLTATYARSLAPLIDAALPPTD